MRRRTWIILGASAAVLIVVGGVVAWELFAPESKTRVNEAAPGQGSAQVLKEGSFTGKDGHSVSGMVKLLRVGDDLFLRFEHYDQTAGPDVYVYLTPSNDPDSGAEINAGQKIYITGGADGGESTKVGSFNQKLPAGLDVARFNGVGVWCDRFNVPFGAAALTPP